MRGCTDVRVMTTLVGGCLAWRRADRFNRCVGGNRSIDFSIRRRKTRHRFLDNHREAMVDVSRLVEVIDF